MCFTFRPLTKTLTLSPCLLVEAYWKSHNMPALAMDVSDRETEAIAGLGKAGHVLSPIGIALDGESSGSLRGHRVVDVHASRRKVNGVEKESVGVEIALEPPVARYHIFFPSALVHLLQARLPQ